MTAEACLFVIDRAVWRAVKHGIETVSSHNTLPSLSTTALSASRVNDRLVLVQ